MSGSYLIVKCPAPINPHHPKFLEYLDVVLGGVLFFSEAKLSGAVRGEVTVRQGGDPAAVYLDQMFAETKYDWVDPEGSGADVPPQVDHGIH